LFRREKMPEARIEAKPEVKVIAEDKIPHLLFAGELGAVLELIIKDRNGNITEKQVLQSKSFVRQFMEILWAQLQWLSAKGGSSVHSIDDRDASIFGWHPNWDANAAIGVTTRGILVGTGSTAPTVDDYKMETQIGHGTGAGQLQYSAVAFGAPASDATTSQFTVTRDFANGSGGAVTVREIGLAVRVYTYSTYGWDILIIRDVIAGGISVPNGQTLTVNYRIQAVV